MKHLIFLIFLFNATSSYSYFYYDRAGRRIFVKKPSKKEREKRYEEKYGKKMNVYGVPFKTKTIKEDDKIYVFIRGCGKVQIKTTSESDKEANRLSSLKSGEYVKVRMIKGKSCEIGQWDRIFK